MAKSIKIEQSTMSKLQEQIAHRLQEGMFLLNVAVAIYLLLALMSYHGSDPGWSTTGTSSVVENIAGRAGAWFSDLFLHLFGYMAYCFPILFAYLGWLFYRNPFFCKQHRWLTVLRILGFFAIMAAGCGLITLHHYKIISLFDGGGILGSLVGMNLATQFNTVGATLLLTAVLLAGVTCFSGLSWMKLSKYLSACSLQGLANGKTLCTESFAKLKEWYQQRAERKAECEADVERDPLIEMMPRPSVEKPQKMVPMLPVAPAISTLQATVKTEKEHGNMPVFAAPKSKDLPKLNLLDATESDSNIGYSAEELTEKSHEVERRLADFGVHAQVVAVNPGPVITRYELALAPGVKVSKISGLAKDLARSLSTISVRIVDVIPGKSVVGLELPNETRAIVRLYAVLASKQYQQARSPLSLALGKDIAGHPVIVDLAKMPHLLVAGTTGSGKSVGVNAMLLSILYKATPQQVRLILVDPKMLELAIYDGIPHLLTPVVTDMKDAANALRWCVMEMERRYRLMANLGVRNLMGYNQKVGDAIRKDAPIPDPFAPNVAGEDPITLDALPYIVVIIDEFADMMMVVGKKVEQLIARIAQKARAAGIHLILATQRPSVDVITGLIKANIPSRISFQVSSRIDSRTVIDQQGAEQLLGHGDMLYLPPGCGVPVRVHGAFVADQEVHNVVNELKQQGDPSYLEDILAGTSVGTGDENNQFNADCDENGGEQDEYYDLAVEFVTKTRKVSISSIQRRFNIGYNRSARIVEEMERAGVISAAEGSGRRDVLAPPPPKE
jgi:DNA segregation ATPase FtsK/SpoIIIE, S-DNA-T family